MQSIFLSRTWKVFSVKLLNFSENLESFSKKTDTLFRSTIQIRPESHNSVIVEQQYKSMKDSSLNLW